MFETLEPLRVAKDKLVGVKQVLRAVQNGQAEMVFVAMNAEPHVLEGLRQLCELRQIPVIEVPTMAELGKVAGIQVGSATVAVLKA